MVITVTYLTRKEERVSHNFSFWQTFSNFELQSLAIEQIYKRLFLEVIMDDITKELQ